jgi:GLPGLI family protein
MSCSLSHGSLIKIETQRIDMKIIFCFYCCWSISIGLKAQPQFISSGKIVFESKLNLSKEWENRIWLFQDKKKNIPKYHTTLHNLYFTKDKTLYDKNPDTESAPYYDDDVNVDDIIYSDLKNGVFVKRQAVFEETFLLSDSIRKIDWEMTNEVRNIAGFTCHKATAIILDSIYVIAFYADEILTTGGPLSYGNLPGMILGIAIPRMNLTIFATKLELMEPTPEKIKLPAAKSKFDYKTFKEFIIKTMQKFPPAERERYLIRALL